MIIKIKREYFQFVDSFGDGHCLFHSLAQCRACREDVDDGRMLRRVMASFVERNTVPNVDHAFEAMNEDKSEWLQHIRSDEWGTEFDMVVFSILFSTNVISFSNLVGGFHFQSAHSVLRQYHFSNGVDANDLVPETAASFYVLHHKGGRPWEPSSCPSQLNHYGNLYKLDKTPSQAYVHPAQFVEHPEGYDLSKDSSDDEDVVDLKVLKAPVESKTTVTSAKMMLTFTGAKTAVTSKSTKTIVPSNKTTPDTKATVQISLETFVKKRKSTSDSDKKPKKKRSKTVAQVKAAEKKKKVALSWKVSVDPSISKDLNDLIDQSAKEKLLQNQTKEVSKRKEE